MKNNGEKLEGLMIAAMLLIFVTSIWASRDAQRMHEKLAEKVQQTPETAEFAEFVSHLLPATPETAEITPFDASDPHMNFVASKERLKLTLNSCVPLSLDDTTVCIPIQSIGERSLVSYQTQDHTACVGAYHMTLVNGHKEEGVNFLLINDSALISGTRNINEDTSLVVTALVKVNSSATTTRRCTDLSRAKSFVQEWVNLDCPTLKRFSTNQKVLSVNGFGAAVPLFESPLVDTSYVDTVIADDIEDKEIEGLRKHLNPDGVISQLLNNVQKARAEKKIDEVESRVKQVETQIRLFLRTPEIENEIKDIETAHLNEEGGFDCGFIFWYPKASSQLEKDMSLLVGANKRKLNWLDMAVPTFSQSVNVQRYGAELVKKLVKEQLGIELYYRSELD